MLLLALVDIFPPPDEMALSALCVMMVFYGYVLCKASQVIGDGSEMLMLLYGPGIVGGLVIPILGAIPDCAVILISGMGEGTTEEVQNQLSVGVGTLVGSTVMLLTIPWGIGVFLGRRDYDEVTDAAAHTPERKPKHTHTSLWTNCVTTLPEIPGTSRIMILSLIGYLIIQLPSFEFSTDKDGGVTREKPWAFGCMVFSGIAFLIYCYLQVRGAESAELERRKQEVLRREQWKSKLDRSLGERNVQEMVFRMYDKDNSGFIEPEELSRALAHLGLQVGRKDLSALFESIDVGHEHDGDAGKSDGRISLAEFGAAVKMWVDAGQNSINLREKEEQHKSFRLRKEDVKSSVSYGAIEAGGALSLAGHNLDEEEEEEEEEYWDLSETELKVKACVLLLLGTLCVTIFSDPMVDVITQVGDRLSVSPFYIAFVVTPLASNASEVYAGLLFARKKTNESISMTLATLHGAATMNSTLALSIFMAIIYARGLEWEYTAEVATVMFVVIVVGIQGMWRRNIFLWQALLVLSLYPGSILMVYVLQLMGFK